MITIKTTDKDNAELIIEKGTPHTTMLLGIEMLIEALIENSSANLNIDIVLDDLKRIYERDRKENIDTINKLESIKKEK